MSVYTWRRTLLKSFFFLPPTPLQAVGKELVQLGDLGGDGEIDGAVADLDDEAAQDLRVDLVPDLELLALAVLGLGDGVLEAAESPVVEGLHSVSKGRKKKEKKPFRSSVFSSLT